MTPSLKLYQTQRRLLQTLLWILLIVPLTLSPIAIFSGLRGFYWVYQLGSPEPIVVDLDNDLRYLASVFFTLGLVLAWTIPQIEKQTALFRLIALGIFIGGIARLISFYQVGSPGALNWMLTVVELLFPLLALWQSKVARLGAQAQ